MELPARRRLRCRAMRLGVFGLNASSTYRPDDTVRLARLAEELGFDSVWAGEHVVLPSPRVAPAPMEPTDPDPRPARAPRLRGRRHRADAARHRHHHPPPAQPAGPGQAGPPRLDVLSDGRLLLGIGAGYLEPEMTAIGAPMDDRGARTDDYVAAMRALWTEPGPVELRGLLRLLRRRRRPPAAGQAGGPRVIVGGHTPAAYRRAVAPATAGTASPSRPRPRWRAWPA